MTAAQDSAATRPTLAVAGESAYAAATASYNLAVDVSPQFAATATTVPEVQALVAAAAAQNLAVRVHATGHAAASTREYGPDEVLIRVRLEGGVTVDPEARTAVIPAGAVWAEVLAASAPHGLVPLHGSSPTVGAIGYLLRGGLSFYGRRYGIASNSVTSITLVTADGALVTVDSDNDRELFDALRGGGGGFGVVVSVTVSLFAADTVFTGAAFWPVAEAPFLLQAWEEWAETAPPEASTAFRVMTLPPLPGVPPQLTAGPVVCIDGAVLDGKGRTGAAIAADLLEPLRRRAEPLLDTWHPGTPPEVPATHMDPPEPIPFQTDHQMLTTLGAAGREALLSIAGTAAGADLMIVELRQLGGALAEADPRGGVVNSLPGAYGSLSVGVLAGPDAAARVASQLAGLRAALGPWDTGRTAPSFVDRFDTPQESFDAAVAARVEAVRRRVDPQGMFDRDASSAVPAGAAGG
ncbi:FAD-binding protein [Arthrobacter sp. TMN-37]